MRPSLHPCLVNGRFGDPAVYVEMMFQRGALLFDMGDLGALATRDLLRVTHVFVSHVHMDHFIGFDRLLRVLVGREKILRLFGPPGFCTRVHHRLQAYEWDLVDRYATDLVFDVTEIDLDVRRRARFRFKRRFAWEEPAVLAGEGPIAEEPGFVASAALLDHHGPCIGYAVAEPVHANVWKVRLEELGLATGQWLQALKRAVVGDAPDDVAIDTPRGPMPLGELRDLVTLSRGQKIAYVTDVADTPINRSAIASLAARADILFIEASFAAADAGLAAERGHLTTTAAGRIGRAARVRRLEPFHFSPRYEGEADRMIAEVQCAFGGAGACGEPAAMAGRAGIA